MVPFYWDTAIVGAIHFAIGLGCIGLGNYLSQRINSRTGAAVLSWPCYAVGVVYLSSAVFIELVNQFGPIVAWVLSWWF